MGEILNAVAASFLEREASESQDNEEKIYVKRRQNPMSSISSMQLINALDIGSSVN